MVLTIAQILFGLSVNVELSISCHKMPYGPCMCRQACVERGDCMYPIYTQAMLKCCLSNNTGIDPSGNSSIHRLDMKGSQERKTKPIIKNGRLLVTRIGKQVIVPLSAKTENVFECADGRCNHQRLERRIPQKVFSLKDLGLLATLDCKVLSMAISKKTPHLAFLLLSCMKLRRCYRVLQIMDINTESLQDNYIEFCEAEEGNRQIFTGACVVDTTEFCLHSINYGETFLITTYKEPVLGIKTLKPELKRRWS